MKITRRWMSLSSLSLLGAVLFLPSIIASASPRPPVTQLLVFVGAVTAVCTASTWYGLRCADLANLPMPYLRRLDHVAELPQKQGFGIAITFGCLFALATIVLLRALHLPNLAGPLWSRVVSVFFAAGSLEIVIYLLIMSFVVKITQGRTWIGIIVAAFFFVLFHASGLPGQTVTVITLTLLMNGLFGLGLGFIYARYGFEDLLLCHAVGHVLAVSLA